MLESVGSCKMPRFKVGDYVERIGPLVPENMRFGRIVRVIGPPTGLPDKLTWYEIAFHLGLMGTCGQTELRLAEDPGPDRLRNPLNEFATLGNGVAPQPLKSNC